MCNGLPPTSDRDALGSRGFSLLELLVAMAVVGLLIGAVYGVFINFLSASGQQAALSNRAFDLRAGLFSMRQDLGSAGLGIDKTQLDNAVAGNSSAVTILSTGFTGYADPAGQFGVFEDGDVLGVGSSTLGVALTGNRELAAGKDYLANMSGVADGQFFFAGNQDGGEPYYFQRQFRLSGAASDSCGSNTQTLLWDDVNGSSAPIVECVLNFRVLYGYQQNGGGIEYTTTTSSPPGNPEDLIPDILKVGLMVQAGDHFGVAQVPSGTLNYSDSDLSGVGAVSLSPLQQNYEWTRVEWSIPLPNMS